jgi:hypothetical protein
MELFRYSRRLSENSLQLFILNEFFTPQKRILGCQRTVHLKVLVIKAKIAPTLSGKFDQGVE